MIKPLAAIWLFCISSIVLGQSDLDHKTDSLLGVINNNASDSAVANALCSMAELLGETDPDQAMEYAKRALLITDQNHLPKAKARALVCTGTLYTRQNRYEEAQTYYLSALKAYEAIDRKRDIAHVYNNMGWIYFSQNNDEKALECYLQARQIYETVNDSLGLAESFNNIGSVYGEMQQYKKALEMYEQALAIQRKKNEVARYIAYTLSNIANAAILLGDNKKARGFGEELLSLLDKLNDPLTKVHLLEGLAAMYQNGGNPHEAIKYSLKALKAGKGVHGYVPEWSYGILAWAYDKQGKYKQAYHYQTLLQGVKDSLYKADIAKQTEELQTKYEAEKKERELLKERSSRELLEKEQGIERNRHRILLVRLSALMLMTVILVYLRYVYITRKRQQRFSRELLTSIDKERSRIAKDLHDGVGPMLSLVKNKLDLNRKKDKGLFQEIDNDIDHVIAQTREISHRLYPSYLKKVGIKKAIANLLKVTEDSSKITCSFEMDDIDERINIDVKTHLYRIVQECVNNTIKHAQATALRIIIVNSDDKLRLTYMDNGKGMKRKDKRGMGLMSITERIKMLHGNVEQGTNNGKGIKFVFSIPVYNHKQ